MKPSFKYKYAIRGEVDGIITYFVMSRFNPSYMGEFCFSLAYLFNNKKDAKNKIEELKTQYKGIKNWVIEYRKVLPMVEANLNDFVGFPVLK